MTEMPKETLPFDNKGPENNRIISDGMVAESTEGSSALILKPDCSEEKDRDAEIGRIKEENILPFTKTPEAALITSYSSGEAIRKPGVVGPVGNQGREASGGDGTGEKRKRMPKWLLKTIAALSAAATLVTGGKVLADNGFFGGNNGNENEGTVPLSSVTTTGEMPSQSIDPVTPSAEVTPSPSPTEAPTPPLDEFGFTKEKREALDQQFKDFLNKQGEFTQEKIFSMMMVTLSGFDSDKVGLGIASNQPMIQGYFFDYFERDNRIFLLMGFDGTDGNRFITPVEMPLYAYEAFESIFFSIFTAEENYIGSQSVGIDEDYGDRAKLIPMLDTLKGKAICFSLSTYIYDKEKEKPEDFGQIGLEYFNEINSKAKLGVGLAQLVQSNGIDYDIPDNVEGDSSFLLKMESVDDLNNIKTENVPIILGIEYFINI